MKRAPNEYRKVLIRAARRFARAAKHAALFNPRHGRQPMVRR